MYLHTSSNLVKDNSHVDSHKKQMSLSCSYIVGCKSHHCDSHSYLYIDRVSLTLAIQHYKRLN